MGEVNTKEMLQEGSALQTYSDIYYFRSRFRL